MTITESYMKLTQLVNGNATNNNINVDRARFIMLFNTELIRFVEDILDKKNDDTLRYVADLLVTDKELGRVGNKPTHISFKLPADYFDLVGAYSIGGGECEPRLKMFEEKSDNFSELYEDKNSEPSIKARETFYTTGAGNLLVYRKGFDIAKAFLTYYKYPKKVDIAGYIHLDGKQSTNIDSDLPDKVVEKVLRMVAKEVSANSGNAGQYQLDKDRL